MKKGAILNQALSAAIAGLGHLDRLAVTDAGCPRPINATVVDLAITQDMPTIEFVLELLIRELIYEKVEVASAQKECNPLLHRNILRIIRRCPVDIVESDELMHRIQTECKLVVRTGAFSPWGNVIFTCGVDAPKWFSKPEVVTPEFYRSRVEYRDNEE